MSVMTKCLMREEKHKKNNLLYVLGPMLLYSVSKAMEIDNRCNV